MLVTRIKGEDSLQNNILKIIHVCNVMSARRLVTSCQPAHDVTRVKRSDFSCGRTVLQYCNHQNGTR